MKSFALIVTVLIAGVAHAGQDAAQQPAQHAPAATSQRMLPLDHGPRAQSTPWLNQQTRQREAKDAAAAAGAAATAKAPASQPAA